MPEYELTNAYDRPLLLLKNECTYSVENASEVATLWAELRKTKIRDIDFENKIQELASEGQHEVTDVRAWLADRGYDLPTEEEVAPALSMETSFEDMARFYSNIHKKYGWRKKERGVV